MRKQLVTLGILTGLLFMVMFLFSAYQWHAPPETVVLFFWLSAITWVGSLFFTHRVAAQEEFFPDGNFTLLALTTLFAGIICMRYACFMYGMSAVEGWIIASILSFIAVCFSLPGLHDSTRKHTL